MAKRRLTAMVLFLAPFAVTTCVIESNDQTKIVGAPCIDGDGCGKALLCFVPDHDPAAGRCIEPPKACDGKKSCDCMDELGMQCDTGLTCVGFVHSYTVGCTPGGNFRQLDETCSWVVPCAPGLLCLARTYGRPGICEPQPACLADDSQNPCDCLAQEAVTACPSGSGSCFVAGGFATLTCS